MPSASRSRRAVRREISSSRATSATVTRPRVCSSRRTAIRRSARTSTGCGRKWPGGGHFRCDGRAMTTTTAPRAHPLPIPGPPSSPPPASPARPSPASPLDQLARPHAVHRVRRPGAARPPGRGAPSGDLGRRRRPGDRPRAAGDRRAGRRLGRRRPRRGARRGARLGRPGRARARDAAAVRHAARGGRAGRPTPASSARTPGTWRWPPASPRPGTSEVPGRRSRRRPRKLPTAERPPEIPFGDAVPVPDDAPVIDRLVAWQGRDPHWRPGRLSGRRGRASASCGATSAATRSRWSRSERSSTCR